MPYTTDERLKSYLDTNQLHREQLCLAVMSLDKRFTDVRPRHPRGGPDGGRDLEAMFRNELLAYGAVGFVNQADDSEEKKKTIKRKFAEDLGNAKSSQPTPQAFFFFSNVNLTVGEKEALSASARDEGMTVCEVFDRERLRIALDSADGFAARFQFLGIPLSEEEQATFFAKWGDDINSVIATGFQEVQRTLDHLLFLQESLQPLSSLQVGFELSQAFSAEEIGHFRAFCVIQLKQPTNDIISVVFGSSDKANRFRRDTTHSLPLDMAPGIKNGMSGVQWERRMPREYDQEHSDSSDPMRYVQVSDSSSMGRDVVAMIVVDYDKDTFIRFEPCIRLIDFNECHVLPMLNLSLAQKVKAVHIIANGYKLLEIPAEKFIIDRTAFETDFPYKFDAVELQDPWCRIRPKTASSIALSFINNIPHRVFKAKRIQNSLPIRSSR